MDIKKTYISASILGSDFLHLEKEIKMIEAAGADMLHLDIMDGEFVPNISFGVDLIKAIRNCTNMRFDTHLMVENPERHIDAFAKAGCDIITIHAEVTNDIHRDIDQIHACGKMAGLALNPATNENLLKYIHHKLDYILVMTVNPGFYGQQFIESQLDKIANISAIINGRDDIMLAVDGGLNKITAEKCRNAGANVIVAANYIFASENYGKAIDELRGI